MQENTVEEFFTVMVNVLVWSKTLWSLSCPPFSYKNFFEFHCLLHSYSCGKELVWFELLLFLITLFEKVVVNNYHLFSKPTYTLENLYSEWFYGVIASFRVQYVSFIKYVLIN